MSLEWLSPVYEIIKIASSESKYCFSSHALHLKNLLGVTWVTFGRTNIAFRQAFWNGLSAAGFSKSQLRSLSLIASLLKLQLTRKFAPFESACKLLKALLKLVAQQLGNDDDNQVEFTSHPYESRADLNSRTWGTTFSLSSQSALSVPVHEFVSNCRILFSSSPPAILSLLDRFGLFKQSPLFEIVFRGGSESSHNPELH